VLVVADSSPLIYLSRVRLLDLLPTLFGDVVVPRAVWDVRNAPIVRTLLPTVDDFDTVLDPHVDPEPLERHQHPADLLLALT